MVDRTLTLIQDDGKEIVCDILFTHHADKFDKDYVVFQVRETGEVSAARYFPSDNSEGHLGAVETEEEWALLEELLNDFASQMNEESSCGGCGGSCGSCGGCGEDCSCDGDCGCGESDN